jgi:hypothetical protein
MLKIYLDWNIISYLKEEEYIDLRNYISILTFSMNHKPCSQGESLVSKLCLPNKKPLPFRGGVGERLP